MNCPRCSTPQTDPKRLGVCSSCNKPFLRFDKKLLPAHIKQHHTGYYMVIMLKRCDLVGVGKTRATAAADLVFQMKKCKDGVYPHVEVKRVGDVRPAGVTVLESWKTPIFCRMFLRLYAKQRLRWGKGKKERYSAYTRGVDLAGEPVMWEQKK